MNNIIYFYFKINFQNFPHLMNSSLHSCEQSEHIPPTYISLINYNNINGGGGQHAPHALTHVPFHPQLPGLPSHGVPQEEKLGETPQPERAADPQTAAEG